MLLIIYIGANTARTLEYFDIIMIMMMPRGVNMFGIQAYLSSTSYYYSTIVVVIWIVQ